MDTDADLLQIKIDKARMRLPKETREAIDAVDWKGTILQMRETKGYSFEQLEDLEIETDLLLAGIISPDNYPKELEARMKLPKGQVDELVNEMNELVFRKVREEMIKATARKKMMEPIKIPEPVIVEKKPPVVPIKTTPQVFKEVTKPVTLNLPEIEAPKTDTQVFGSAGIEIVQPKETERKNDLPLEKEEEMNKLNNFISGKVPTSQPSSAPVPAIILPPKPVVTTVEEPLHGWPAGGPSMLTAKLSGSFKIPSVTTEHTLPNVSKGPAGNSPIGKVVDPYRLSPDE